jgi:hypothetical protein
MSGSFEPESCKIITSVDNKIKSLQDQSPDMDYINNLCINELTVGVLQNDASAMA